LKDGIYEEDMHKEVRPFRCFIIGVYIVDHLTEFDEKYYEERF